MESLRPNSKAIVLVPAPSRPGRRSQMPLALRAASLLPALVSTPRRALFTAGVAFGLAGPPAVRFLAARVLPEAVRSLVGLPSRTAPRPEEEIVVERFSAVRIFMKSKR